MSFIARYRDWDKQRLNLYARKTRQTEAYGYLALPKEGQVLVIENVMASFHLTGAATTNLANLQLVVCNASGQAAGVPLSGTNTGTSATVCTVSGGGMTVDAYQYMLLRYTSGANSGKVRRITSNNATTITTATFTTAPANGDTFEVINQFGITPILPMWRMRGAAAQRLSVNKVHRDLEIVLGEDAGIGYIARQMVDGADTWVQPTEFSIGVQARYEPAGYRSTFQNPQIQPNGTLP